MKEIDNSKKMEVIKAEETTEYSLVEIADGLLYDARAEVVKKDALSVPIAQLSTLGAGVSSLLPALRTVTQTGIVEGQGLYRLANQVAGDSLKVAKDGNFWGAFKTAEGTSKLVKLEQAGTLSMTTKAIAPINPATMMMAVALFSIEQKLGEIEKMQRQILSFLEIEKESEIEADVETLSNVVSKYKSNWDNEYYVSGNHKLVLDIQRTALKNINGYKKKIEELQNSKKFVVIQNQVDTTLNDLQKKFKYYRLSLYTYSLASLMEIMLSGNFKEEYIVDKKDEIANFSSTYRDLFAKSSVYLEKMSRVSVQNNARKAIGATGKAVGRLVNNIPRIKVDKVDKFLQDKSEDISLNAQEIEKSAIKAFAEVSNPETRVIMDKMDDMVRIFNYTERICFDNENVYLLAD